MNKTAIKNFAIWARNKLIADITYKAGLLGIIEKEIKSPLPQSTKDVKFFDIGTKEPYSITGDEIKQREKLAEIIINKAKQSDYANAYKSVIEEVAYTWFNRLIAVRFMEVNDYLPSRIRVLSSESATKAEPDMVTTPFDTDLEFTPYEKDRIVQLTHDNQLDELFRMLFIKQCNAFNANLPNLFEKTSDYTELLLNVSFTDKDGVVYRLVHEIPEDDFNVSKEGQIEIIGWLYEYYNTEPKDEAFALLKKNIKITKERIPAVTQLFTPDWIVRYMVENSLGRLWIERERACMGVSGEYLNGSYFGWKYYLEEAEQESEVEVQLKKIREEYKKIKPEDIKVIDPCMGSGHILVYAFDVLMQIYESQGWSKRDAAKSILENNLYGLDIDNRAYQLAFFAVMMKARQYNRRVLNGEIDCHVYSIQESNGINRRQLTFFGAGMSDIERNIAILQIQGLLDTFIDAKEYGSILNVENYNWELLYRFVSNVNMNGQLTLDTMGIEDTREQLRTLVEIGAMMAQKYDIVITNPPYMGASGFDTKMSEYVKQNYSDNKSDLFSVFIEKGINLLKINGLMSYITMQAWMFLASYDKLRYKIACQQIESLVQIGFNSFPELNSQVAHAVTFTVRKTGLNGFIGKYFNLNTKKTTDDKDVVFQCRIAKSQYYLNSAKSFIDIPNHNFAFWLTENEKDIIIKSRSLGEIIEIRQGLATGDNNRFLREWHEVDFAAIGIGMLSGEEFLKCSKKYAPYNKSGDFRKWYGNISSIVNWENDGFEIKHFVDAHGKLRSRPQNIQYYFKKGVTWSLISTNTFAARLSGGGFIFDVGGSSGFPDGENVWYILGLLCSRVTYSFLKAFNPTINFQIGDIKNIPIIQDTVEKVVINDLVKQNVSISKSDWDSFETSWDFPKHPLVRDKSTISSAFDQWEEFTKQHFSKLKANEEELNRIFIDIYGLQDELTPEVEDKDVTIRKADLGRDIRSFVSYAVGCMFGRYCLDVDGLVYAGGQWDASKYSTFIPDKDNILPITDEEYFKDDIVGLFVAFVKKVYGSETLEQNLDFIANALGNKGNTSREIIRNYFVKDFFKDHCKIYQKRPIYWLFDSGRADGFKALVYMHRYSENTIGNLRIDYLHRMQRVYDSEIARMQETIENSTNAREVAAAEKRKEKLIKQLKETKEYDEKIAHLALARIAIDLDDGVAVNYEKVQTDADGKKLEVMAKI
ncbi:MAG: restriction endonuclease [Clostridiaceae bacterium BRH_c20a]|nr:MAG: restriction endonuclease [Clostridiaceae bacterium BRH_c20a]